MFNHHKEKKVGFYVDLINESLASNALMPSSFVEDIEDVTKLHKTNSYTVRFRDAKLTKNIVALQKVFLSSKI